jgi:hypothetical protein
LAGASLGECLQKTARKSFVAPERMRSRESP